MSVLTRMVGWLLLAGLLVGVILRWTLGRRRFRTILAVLVFVPAILHAGCVTIQALGHRAAPLGVLAFLAGAAAVVVAGWLVGRRWIDRHGLWAALVPSAVGGAYGALPFALYSWALRQRSIDLDIVPTAAYLGACLLGTALLLPFVPGSGGLGRGWLRGFGRRR